MGEKNIHPDVYPPTPSPPTQVTSLEWENCPSPSSAAADIIHFYPIHIKNPANLHLFVQGILIINFNIEIKTIALVPSPVNEC